MLDFVHAGTLFALLPPVHIVVAAAFHSARPIVSRPNPCSRFSSPSSARARCEAVRIVPGVREQMLVPRGGRFGGCRIPLSQVCETLQDER